MSDFFLRRFYPKFFRLRIKNRGELSRHFFAVEKGSRFSNAWIGNLVRAATAAAGSGAASDARTRVAPDEHALARAVSGLPARRALTHAPPVCVSLECSSARARRRQEAREWRRENADGTRWRVLVGRRRARARLTPLRCRQRPWRPTEFEQLRVVLASDACPSCLEHFTFKSGGGFKKKCV